MLSAIHTIRLRRRLVRWLSRQCLDDIAPSHALWCALMGHRARCHYPACTITEFGWLVHFVTECRVSMADLRRAYLIDPALKPYIDYWHLLSEHYMQALNAGNPADYRGEVAEINSELSATAAKSQEIEQQTKLPRQ